MDPRTLRKICNVTSTDLNWILYGNDSPPIIHLEGTYGERIRSIRLMRNITVRQLSLAVFNVEKCTSVPGWERDRHTPELRTLLTLAKYYGISAASFIP